MADDKKALILHKESTTKKPKPDPNYVGYFAKWGPKGFVVTPKKVVPFTNLRTAHGLVSEWHEDTSGPEPVNVRAKDKQTITFDTKYLYAVGTYPKNQMKQWYDLVGMAYPMYIGGKQFGPPLLQLKKVDFDKFQFGVDGEIISVDCHITLQEYSGEKKEISKKKFAEWIDADKKKAALISGPSKQDKEKRGAK